MKTIYFPEKTALIGGVSARSERSAYLDGIAILQEVSAITEMYSPVNHDAATEIARLTQRTGRLGDHLRDCAEKVFPVSSDGPGSAKVENLAREVERQHLRQSMKERFVDLAAQIGANSPRDLSREYSVLKMERDALQREVLTMRSCNFPDVAIMRTLGVNHLPKVGRQVGEAVLSFRDLPEYPDYPQYGVYKHVNSKGVTYYLHRTEVTLRGGHSELIYFFAKVVNNGRGTPADLPEDRVVKENPRNGFLTVSKSK